MARFFEVDNKIKAHPFFNDALWPNSGRSNTYARIYTGKSIRRKNLKKITNVPKHFVRMNRFNDEVTTTLSWHRLFRSPSMVGRQRVNRVFRSELWRLGVHWRGFTSKGSYANNGKLFRTLGNEVTRWLGDLHFQQAMTWMKTCSQVNVNGGGGSKRRIENPAKLPVLQAKRYYISWIYWRTRTRSNTNRLGHFVIAWIRVQLGIDLVIAWNRHSINEIMRYGNLEY